jgi:geranylgeranyl pyrophosphate synthase
MLWAVVEFSLGILLTREESKLVQPLTDIANRIIVQTNDYFGWEVDRALQKDQIFNLVLCIKEEHGIADKEAKERLKSLIVYDEEMYQSMLDNFYKTHPNLPVHLRKYVAAGPLFVGGNHNWSADCGRYKPRKPHKGMTLPTESTQMKAINIIPDLEQIVMDDRCTPYTAPNKIATVQAIEASRLDDSALLAPPRYVQSLPSKNIRSKLADALNIWFQLPEDRLDMLKGLINDLHNATLILDDIQDESILRRGSSAAHCIFGPAQCINSATYMVVQAALRLHHHKNLEAIGTFLQGLSDLAVGQSWDLNWKVNSYCPSIGEYFAMVDGKTGALFKMLVHLMQSVSSLKRFPVADLDRFTLLLGRWYQIRDDYQNLQDPEYTEQKGFCEDLDEGKLSYPVVLCCNSNPTSRTIILGIFKRTKNGLPLARSVKMQILDLLGKSGALVETWKIIQQLEKEVRDSLSTLEQTLGEPNPPLRLVTELLGDIPSP